MPSRPIILVYELRGQSFKERRSLLYGAFDTVETLLKHLDDPTAKITRRGQRDGELECDEGTGGFWWETIDVTYSKE